MWEEQSLTVEVVEASTATAFKKTLGDRHTWIWKVKMDGPLILWLSNTFAQVLTNNFNIWELFNFCVYNIWGYEQIILNLFIGCNPVLWEKEIMWKRGIKHMLWHSPNWYLQLKIVNHPFFRNVSLLFLSQCFYFPKHQFNNWKSKKQQIRSKSGIIL